MKKLILNFQPLNRRLRRFKVFSYKIEHQEVVQNSVKKTKAILIKACKHIT